MNELTMCMAGAILLLVVVCVVTWAQVQRLKADVENLYREDKDERPLD